MTPNPQIVNAQPVDGRKRTSDLAVATLVIGILAAVFWHPLWIMACIVSVAARRQLANNRALKGHGLVTAGLVIAIFFGGIGMAAEIMIPRFIAFQGRSKQSECKASLQEIARAEQAYFAKNGSYSASLPEIGFSAPGHHRYECFLEGGPLPAVGVQGECPKCSFTAACAGNIDRDDTLDVWSISSTPRTADGRSIPAGEPYNDVDDVYR